MAQFTVTLNSKVNSPPDAIGFNNIIIPDPADVFTFTVIDFTTGTNPQYHDPDGDDPLNVKVLTLPDAPDGVLKLDGVDVIINQEISIIDINASKLTFEPTETVNAFNSEFTFDMSDIGSALYSGLPDGKIEFTVGAQVNQPPTVGDGDQTIEWAASLIFTRAMFTAQTTPAYSDPEGDVADKLKILSLPVDGLLQVDGVDVTINVYLFMYLIMLMKMEI